MREPEHPTPPVPAIFDGAALEVLEEILTTLRSASPSLAVTEQAAPQHLAIDFPFAGASRWLLPRQPTGGLLAVEEAPSTLLIANPNRMGGAIVNIGEKEVILVLSEAGEAAAHPTTLGQIGLVGGGGSWDLRLADLVWCGSVAAFSVGGASKVTVAEV